MSGADRLIAYRTMRAVQAQAPTERPESLWARWQAAIYRLTNRLLG